MALWAPICSATVEGVQEVEEEFLRGLYKNCRLTRMYGKERAEQNRREKYELQAALTLAQINLEGSPQSIEAQVALSKAEMTLHTF